MPTVKALRRVSWGMTPAEVKSAEESVPVDSDGDSLMYKVELFGFEAFLRYAFQSARLVQGVYIFDSQAGDTQDVAAYERIRGALKAKYGKPVSQAQWRGLARKTFPATYGEMAKAVAT